MPRVFKMRGHRGYNICPWLKNGKHETCGKSCREEYCKVHRLKIRNGRKIPRPCLSCGVGVISQIQLCRGCGRETERKRLVKTRAKQPQLYNSEWMVTIPFVSFSLPTTPCPSAAPCLTSPPSKYGARDKPDTYMQERGEYCFGLRDWIFIAD